MNIDDSVYWDGGGSVGGEVNRGDNGKVYSDVGSEVGSGHLEEVELESGNKVCSGYVSIVNKGLIVVKVGVSVGDCSSPICFFLILWWFELWKTCGFTDRKITWMKWCYFSWFIWYFQSR